MAFLDGELNLIRWSMDREIEDSTREHEEIKDTNGKWIAYLKIVPMILLYYKRR